LSYEPGGSVAHRLDPRSKLLVQGGFAAAAFVYTTPRGLAALTAVAFGLLAVARTAPHRVLWEFRFVFPFLFAAPLLDGFAWGVWFVPEDAIPPALAGYRVLLVLLVAAAYVRTTPVRDSRAAIQWAVPGRSFGIVRFPARHLRIREKRIHRRQHVPARHVYVLSGRKERLHVRGHLTPIEDHVPYQPEAHLGAPARRHDVGGLGHGVAQRQVELFVAQQRGARSGTRIALNDLQPFLRFDEIEGKLGGGAGPFDQP
jgi:hypothetical protein